MCIRDSGLFTYTHNNSETTSDSFTYTVDDGNGGTDTATVNITITPVNDAPTTTPIVLTAIAEDTGFRVITQDELLANANDIEGDALTATGLTITAGEGTIVPNPDGSFTFMPASNDDTAVTFSYTITDGAGNVTGTATLDITPVNDAPIIIDHGYSTVDGTFNGVIDPVFTGRGTHFSDQALVVDTSQVYELSANAFATDSTGGPPSSDLRHFLGFASYDVDGNTIRPLNVYKNTGAVDTTLAVDLQPGDTQIVLNDATGWHDANVGHARSLAWYGYEDSTGQIYEDYTYTRNVVSDLWDPGAINGNVITLREPWTGPELSAGDAVRNAASGATYNYSLLSGESVPDTPTEYSDTFGGGESVNGERSPSLFRPGTHSIQLLVLSNYTPVGDAFDTDSLLHVDHFELSTAVGPYTEGFAVFNEGDSPLSLVDEDAVIEDVDDIYIESVTVELTNGREGDILHVNEAALAATGISVTGIPATTLSGDGSILLTLTADTTESVTRQDFAAALTNIEFENISENPDESDRIVNFVANDGELDSPVSTLVIRVVNVNDTPTTAPVVLTPIAEDSGFRVITQADLLANAADIDNSLLTATDLEISAGLGELVDNKDGTWNFTPATDDDTNVSFTYNVTDGIISVNGSATLDITPVNDAPTVTLINTANSLFENSTDTNSVRVADIVINDDSIGSETLTLTGVDASSFEIVGNELHVRAGTVLDFETPGNQLDVQVNVDDPTLGAGIDSTDSLTVVILDVDEFNVTAPSDINQSSNEVSESATTGTAVGITASASDADGSNNTITFSLDNDAGGRFAIDSISGAITVANASLLDHETEAVHDLIVRATSSDGSSSTAVFTVQVADANEHDPTINNQNFSVAENSATGVVVGDVIASDADTSQTLTYTLANDSSGGGFAIDPSTGRITVLDGSLLDFETANSHTLDIIVTDDLTPSRSSSATVTVNLTDQNEAPTVSLSNVVTNIDENVDTSVGIRIADIEVIDDAIGTNLVSLTGADAANFEISNGELRLIAGAVVDFETFTQLDVTIELDDPTLGNSLESSVSHTLNVNDLTDIAPVIQAGHNDSGGEDEGGNDSPTIEDVAPELTLPTTDGNASESLSATETNNGQGLPTEDVSGQQTSTLLNEDISESSDDDEDDFVQQQQQQSSIPVSALLRRTGESSTGQYGNYTGLGTGTSFVANIPLSISSQFADAGDDSGEALLNFEEFVVGTSAITSTSLTVGYVLWLIRGGTLLASFASALPAWTSFDPLALVKDIEDENTESLANIVENANG